MRSHCYSLYHVQLTGVLFGDGFVCCGCASVCFYLFAGGCVFGFSFLFLEMYASFRHGQPETVSAHEKMAFFMNSSHIFLSSKSNPIRTNEQQLKRDFLFYSRARPDEGLLASCLLVYTRCHFFLNKLMLLNLQMV